MHRQQPHSGTQAGPCRQDGGSRHSLRTGNEQGAAEVSLMCKLLARLQQIVHVFTLQQLIVRTDFFYGLFAQADVQQVPLAHELLVLGKEESQLGQLQAERYIGADDVCPYIICILFAHQSRRDVDGDYLRGRGINVLHYCGKTTAQRLVEPAAEESVHYYRLFRQHRRDELRGHFVEVHFSLFEKTVFVRCTIGGEFSFDVQQIDGQPVAAFRQQA